jgi:hypothetical protein
VLHTDQGHPHVHLVVKAQSEQGERLNIYKATLTQWREDFAAQLRDLGVGANATPNALRGRKKEWKPDGIYRALRRRQSTFMRRKVEAIAEELGRGQITREPGKAMLVATRNAVVADWEATAALLRAQGQQALAQEVDAYLRRMSHVATENEAIAKGLLSGLAAQATCPRVAERDRSADQRTR